jgi:hypothetical protein
LDRRGVENYTEICSQILIVIKSVRMEWVACLACMKGKGKGVGKAVPLQAWSDPEGSRKLRFPNFVIAAH